MIDAYTKTITAAARDADYAAASASGEEALEAKRNLETMDPLFVTGLVGVEDSTAWLAGEVRQYAELKALMDGSKGTLVARMPLTWAFKSEKPLPADWRYDGPQGAVPLGDDRFEEEEPSLANGWRTVRSGLTYRPKMSSRLMAKVTSAITGTAAPWNLPEVPSTADCTSCFPACSMRHGSTSMERLWDIETAQSQGGARTIAFPGTWTFAAMFTGI